jgi:nitric oxide reductase subunit C
MIGALVMGWALLGTAGAADKPEVYDKKCKICHSIGTEKGPMASKGGPLDGVGAKRDEAWLRAYLADPKSKIPDAKMPRAPLTPEELEALIAFLLSLK